MSRSGPNAEGGQFMNCIYRFLTTIQERIPVNDVIAPANISARRPGARRKILLARKTVASRDNLEGNRENEKKTQMEKQMKTPDGKS